MQAQITGTDLDIHCLKRRDLAGVSRTRVNKEIKKYVIYSICVTSEYRSTKLTCRFQLIFIWKRPLYNLLLTVKEYCTPREPAIRSPVHIVLWLHAEVQSDNECVRPPWIPVPNDERQQERGYRTKQMRVTGTSVVNANVLQPNGQSDRSVRSANINT